jgi:hypothetical protein
LPTIRQLTRPSTLPLLEVIHPLRENRLYQPTGESASNVNKIHVETPEGNQSKIFWPISRHLNYNLN